MGVLIAPSLLSADFGNFAEAARVCSEAGAEVLHFDVMDGQFVPNITFGAHPIRALRRVSSARFEAHLMIVQPERFIDEIAEAGADLITVHAEACTHLQRTLAQIRNAGAKAGLALNPATSLSALEYVIDDIDLLLIMTVNPGFGGQKFVPATMHKINTARAIIDAHHMDIDLEVDGDIGAHNAARVVSAGANVLVSGTGVFKYEGGAASGIQAIRKAAEGR